MQPRRSPSHAFALVRKRKYDDSIKSEWEGDRLVSPTPEWWLVLHHPARHLKFSADGVEASDLFFLHCCSHVYPLTILLGFGAGGRFKGAKCDAALPATLSGDVITFVDLDLDLIVAADLTYHVRDETQFATHRRTMGYSETVVEQARAGIDLAEQLVMHRRFPFDADFVPRLKMALER